MSLKDSEVSTFRIDHMLGGSVNAEYQQRKNEISLGRLNNVLLEAQKQLVEDYRQLKAVSLGKKQKFEYQQKNGNQFFGECQ